MSHDHSYEEDFMKEMSFDLEDEPTNPQPNTNGNNTPKELDPIQKEQAQIKKPVTKISLNLKAKFMPENPENNKDNNNFHENPGKNMGEGYKENLIKENNDQIMVPGFLLNNKISGGEASTSAIMKQVFPNRYFILKKLTKTQLEICMDSNYCVISLAFKKKLHDAYQVIILNFIVLFVYIYFLFLFFCMYRSILLKNSFKNQLTSLSGFNVFY